MHYVDLDKVTDDGEFEFEDVEYDNIFNEGLDFWYWAGFLTDRELEEELEELEREMRIQELTERYGQTDRNQA